jgi:succinate-semialdehyde dehydrogenase/glutarate-semialdehyde dehydrogenase
MSETFASFNPATGKKIADIMPAGKEEVLQKVARAGKAFSDWSQLDLSDRIACCNRVVDLINADLEAFIALLVEEQGKPYHEAKGEVVDALYRISYFARRAPEVFVPQEWVCQKRGVRAVIEQMPLGLVAAIKPWNFPVGIPLWTIVPALLAGNAVLFKPSEYTPLIGAKLHEYFIRAGVPEDVFALLQGGGDTGQTLVGSDINMIGFVGSREAGVHIMREAAKSLKRVALELGGKDPMLILDDADCEKVITAAVQGAFKNCGQVCCSVERIIVHRAVADDFIAGVVEKTRNLKVGSGNEIGVQIGPLIAESEKKRVLQMVEQAVSVGAELYTGGKSIDRPGYFMEPAVIGNIPLAADIFAEEVFGPVMQIHVVDSDEEALELANSLPFGLTGSVWSGDIDRARKLASRLVCGTRGVNQLISSMVELPWGGCKQSGLGRMLSDNGLKEFSETVVLREPVHL